MLFSGLFDLTWWGYVVTALGLTHLTMAAVTIFLHRCQAHRALELVGEMRGRGSLHEDRGEGQLRDAAELEAAGGEQQSARRKAEGTVRHAWKARGRNQKAEGKAPAWRPRVAADNCFLLPSSFFLHPYTTTLTSRPGTTTTFLIG